MKLRRQIAKHWLEVLQRNKNQKSTNFHFSIGKRIPALWTLKGTIDELVLAINIGNNNGYDRTDQALGGCISQVVPFCYLSEERKGMAILQTLCKSFTLNLLGCTFL